VGGAKPHGVASVSPGVVFSGSGVLPKELIDTELLSFNHSLTFSI